MPYKTEKKCSFGGCPNIAMPNDSLCPEHRKKANKSYDMNREDTRARGYTRRWEHVRKMKLNNQSLCEDCATEGITRVANMVHHIDGNAKHNDMDNLRSLCWHHHGQYSVHSEGSE
jgi:hypothetical protein